MTTVTDHPLSPVPDPSPAIEWIELITGYSCNCSCPICPSAQMAPPARSASLTLAQMSRALDMGRGRGAVGVWFGGGEPTLHPGLPATVNLARRMGYEKIRIQTNAMRLAYPDYARRLVSAGVDRVALSVMGAYDQQHNEVTRHERSFELLVQAAGNLRGLRVRLEADVLITAKNVNSLSDVVQRFTPMGVTRFTFWLVSLHGLDFDSHANWVPSMQQVKPALQSAFDSARALGADATTLHTPPCTLDPLYRSLYLHAGRYRLLVIAPGNDPFMAETSPMEGGVYLDQCRDCSMRSGCLGLRDDYLRIHGTEQIKPIQGR